MAETSSSWIALRAALLEAGSDETEFLDEAVRVVRSGLARRPSIEPQSQFTQAEVKSLRQGGLSLEPRNASEPDIVARTAARASVMFIEAKTAGDVAKALGVSAARIRQRAIERTLYAHSQRRDVAIPGMAIRSADRTRDPGPGLGDPVVLPNPASDRGLPLS